MLVPQLSGEFPPLLDLPGHVARYHIMLKLDSSAHLKEFYAFEWALIGNLGADLVVLFLGQWFEADTAARITVAFSVASSSALIMLLSRKLHGSIQPTALLALMFVYSNVFFYGFLNYSLSISLVLWVVYWWSLRDFALTKTVAVAFAFYGFLTWVTHTVGWAALCVVVAAVTLRSLKNAKSASFNIFIKALASRAVPLMALALPLIIMVSNSAAATETGYAPDWLKRKLQGVGFALRDQSLPIDMLSIGLCIAGIGWLLIHPKRVFHAPLLWGSSLLLVVFAIMPNTISGSAFADIRLVPLIAVLALVAIGVPSEFDSRSRSAIWILALGMLAIRMLYTSLGWHESSKVVRGHLQALQTVEMGAKVLSLSVRQCNREKSILHWRQRFEYPHLTAWAVTYRDAFTNALWQMPGGQLLKVNYNSGSRFHIDPSQYVFIGDCKPDQPKLEEALSSADIQRFDSVWVTGSLPQKESYPNLQKTYSDQKTVMFRVIKPNTP
jgi:hypothetical protein